MNPVYGKVNPHTTTLPLLHNSQNGYLNPTFLPLSRLPSPRLTIEILMKTVSGQRLVMPFVSTAKFFSFEDSRIEEIEDKIIGLFHYNEITHVHYPFLLLGISKPNSSQTGPPFIQCLRSLATLARSQWRTLTLMTPSFTA